MSDQAMAALTGQMNEMKMSVEGLEKERDFYFNKVGIPSAYYTPLCRVRYSGVRADIATCFRSCEILRSLLERDSNQETRA